MAIASQDATTIGFGIRLRHEAESFHPRRIAYLPCDLFASTRGSIERVVEQINRSYDVELWDCTAVMCRRLLETLIIETYEKAGRAADIKDKDGQFAMFSG